MLLITLILTLVVVLVIGGLTQLYRLHAEYLELTGLRLQAERYAAAGLERATSMMRIDPAYSGETWWPQGQGRRATDAPEGTGASKTSGRAGEPAEQPTAGSDDSQAERWSVQISVDRSPADAASGTVRLRATAAFGTAERIRVRVTSERRVPNASARESPR